MKIRSGFVSNSSTSSFVVMGFLLDENKHSRLDILKRLLPDNAKVQALTSEEDEDFTDFWYDTKEETKYTIKYGDDDGIDDGKICVGIRIASPSSEDGGLESEECDLDDLKKQVETLRTTLGLCKTEKIKIMSGTYCS